MKERYSEIRDPYDGLRFYSALTHGAGVVLGVIGAFLLLFRCKALGLSALYYTAFSIYLGSMIALYLTSTLYHCLNTGVKGRNVLRKLDHLMIYFLIGGSYTPICLIVLHGAGGWVLFGIIWAMAVAGTVFTLFWIKMPRWLTSVIYIVMGWVAVFAFYPLSKVFPATGFAYLIGGGILYTAGGVLYAVKWPGRNNPRFGCHEIFHLFILLASILHYLMMYQVIALL